MTFLLPFLIAYLIVGVIVAGWVVSEEGLPEQLEDLFVLFLICALWLPACISTYRNNNLWHYEYAQLMEERSAQDLELYGC